MKSKPVFLNGEKVKILRNLVKKISQAGKPDAFVDLVDKEGTWVVVEFLSGKNIGNRFPTTLEKLKKKI